MIKVLFFAQTRELIGLDSMELDYSGSILSLLENLAKRGDKWHLALKEKTVLCAVNQTIVELSSDVKEGDEVAFFPPVTGG